MTVAPDREGEDLEALLVLAITMATEAGQILLQMSSLSEDRATLRERASTKSSRTDLATEADQQSEALIAAMLRRHRPDDGLLAEEGSQSTSRSGVTWIVDPLDGTTNYVFGLSEYAISLAAEIDSVPVVALVHAPARGETFTAVRGRGATLNGRSLAPTPRATSLSDALVATGFGYRSEDRRAQASLLPTVLPAVRDIRRSGSAALDLCSLAAGRFDAYYESGLKPWDCAAGLLICEETGLAHREIDDLSVTRATLVCAPTDLIDDLIALLRSAASAPSN